MLLQTGAGAVSNFPYPNKLSKKCKVCSRIGEADYSTRPNGLISKRMKSATLKTSNASLPLVIVAAFAIGELGVFSSWSQDAARSSTNEWVAPPRMARRSNPMTVDEKSLKQGRNFLLLAVCLATGPPERAMAPPPRRWNATENPSAPATCPTQSSGGKPTERSFGKSAKVEVRCLRFRRPSRRSNAGRLSIMSGRWRHTKETKSKKPRSEANNEIWNRNGWSLCACGGSRSS